MKFLPKSGFNQNPINRPQGLNENMIKTLCTHFRFIHHTDKALNTFAINLDFMNDHTIMNFNNNFK